MTRQIESPGSDAGRPPFRDERRCRMTRAGRRHVADVRRSIADIGPLAPMHRERVDERLARCLTCAGYGQPPALRGDWHEAAGPEGPGGPRSAIGARLDRVADRAQDRADLAAQEDEGDDRDDRDEGEDQRVLGETLAFVVVAERTR